MEQEKFRKLDTDKDESKRLQVVKRKITQQLKKENIQEKIAETHEKIETKRQEERTLWLKPGQRVRIAGGSSVGTIEEVKRNKVIVNYGNFKTTIDADQLERI